MRYSEGTGWPFPFVIAQTSVLSFCAEGNYYVVVYLQNSLLQWDGPQANMSECFLVDKNVFLPVKVRQKANKYNFKYSALF